MLSAREIGTVSKLVRKQEIPGVAYGTHLFIFRLVFLRLFNFQVKQSFPLLIVVFIVLFVLVLPFLIFF